MNKLLAYKDFVNEARKPPLIVPQFVFHTTSADPNIIKEQGLEARASNPERWGRSYRYEPTVFAAKHTDWLFGSSYEYIVVIDTTKCDNVWLYDDNSDYGQWIKTNKSIPPEAIADVIENIWDSPYRSQ